MAATTEHLAAGGPPHLRNHAEEGTNTALMGMLLFIASEVMFFSGLFAAYFTVKGMHDIWPPQGFGQHIEPFPLPAILTIILVSSSFTMQYAVWAIRKGDRRGMIRGLAVTALLGIIFLSGQLYDYSQLGFGINSGVYGSLFFTMTGFHGAHVFGGVLGILVVLSRGASGQFSAKHHVAVEAVSAYWHFVDIVWIALFSTLYFLR
jgi:cytochrome c oxidase subunit III